MNTSPVAAELDHRLKFLVGEVRTAVQQKHGQLIVEASGAGTLYSSGIMLHRERLAQDLVDAALPKLLDAGDHALSLGASEQDVQALVDGAVRAVMNEVVAELQAGGKTVEYGARPAVLAGLAQRAQSIARQHRAGYLKPPVAREGSGNSVSITGSQGVVVQQGTTGSSQTAHVQVDAASATAAVRALLDELDRLPQHTGGLMEAQADLGALKLQLDRGQPDRGLLAALGRSCKTVMEGAISSALSPGAIAIAGHLWAALGIG